MFIFLPVVVVVVVAVVAVVVVVAPPVYRIAILNWVKEGCRKKSHKKSDQTPIYKKLRNHTGPF